MGPSTQGGYSFFSGGIHALQRDERNTLSFTLIVESDPEIVGDFSSISESKGSGFVRDIRQLESGVNKF